MTTTERFRLVSEALDRTREERDYARSIIAEIAAEVPDLVTDGRDLPEFMRDGVAAMKELARRDGAA